MPEIIGLHHAQINVPTTAIDAAYDFYCGVLGLTQCERPAVLKDPGFWLRLGNIDVHVGVEDGVDRHKTKVHLAYQVADLAAWKRHIQEQGIEIETPPQFEGHDRFQFRDPWGNRVELIQVL